MMFSRPMARAMAMLAFLTTSFFAKNTLAQVADEPLNNGSLELDFDSSDTHDNRIPWFTNAELIERVNSLPSSCVRPQFTNEVKSYINTYGVRKREKAEAMLGRRILYFPLFEKYLKLNGMPSELKYLSVTESALNPTAVSSAGATGLWQFMPATGKEYGLDITRAIDERCDPNKSTDAACKYLKRLFSQFGSWELALAAYNSGAGRVSNAIKRSHSTNFWRLQRFLPEETRNYVPAFIGAMYICHYFSAHNLVPETTDLEEQMTSSIRIFETMTFSDIVGATGLPYDLVQKLNPALRQNFVPQSTEGHFVTLPTRVFPAFLKWLNTRGGANYLPDAPIFFGKQSGTTVMANEKYLLTAYKPKPSETIESIAALFGVDAEQLKIWNNLPFGNVQVGRELRVYQPFSLVVERENTKMEGSKAAEKPAAKQKKTTVEVITKPAGSSKKEKEKPTAAAPSAPEKAILTKPIEQKIEPTAPKIPAFHTVQRGESLDDIAAQYGLTTSELMILNPKMDLKMGARLKLKN